jgi:hypothetical protein
MIGCDERFRRGLDVSAMVARRHDLRMIGAWTLVLPPDDDHESVSEGLT